MGQENQKLQVVTVLLIFLIVVMFQIFLVAILIIFVRKIKDLLQSQTKPYFYIILLLIVSKLAIGIVIQLKILSGIPNNWENLSVDFIQLCFKDSLMIGDCCLVQLFLISFEVYVSICFGFLDLPHIGKLFRLTLRIIQVFVFILYVVLIGLFNFDVIHYDINNMVGAALNCLSILAFLVSFFYLNFKMTGIMIETSFNASMKKIYKVIIVLLLSRTINGTFELIIAALIGAGNFSGFINTLIGKQDQYITQAILFIGFILFALLTEGIPIMISLRTSVVLAFNVRYDRKSSERESMFSINVVLNDPLIDSTNDLQNFMERDVQIQLKTFKIVQEIKSEAVEKIMKAKIGQTTYILRQIHAEISNYILEDIENQVKEIQSCKIKPLNKMGFFCENNSVYIYQRYRPFTLDNMIQNLHSVEDQIKLALKIATAIEICHRNEVPHGSLNYNNITFDLTENVYFIGFGLESLRKYLSLTTDYTNKTFYTAVQLLKDRNKVVLRPKKTADIYSFGIILYEVMTKNFDYRTLSLKEVKTKFGSDNFRPKIPENIDGNIKSLMRKCWQQDPLERPNISYITDFLKRLIR